MFLRREHKHILKGYAMLTMPVVSLLVLLLPKLPFGISCSSSRIAGSPKSSICCRCIPKSRSFHCDFEIAPKRRCERNVLLFLKIANAYDARKIRSARKADYPPGGRGGRKRGTRVRK